MRLALYKKCLERFNTLKFLLFISFIVINLMIILMVMFYVVVGNSDVREDLPCENTLTYVEYNKPQIEDFSEWNNNCDLVLTVVNTKNKLPPLYSTDLKELGGVYVDTRMFMNLEDMILDAKNEAGLSLFVTSGYRSIEKQEERFNKVLSQNVQNGFTEDEARNLTELRISKPGFSEHNLGLAVNFNGDKYDFAFTPEYSWLLENSYKYGFILRYPEDKQDVTGMSFKPWHFRYVGEKNAKFIKEESLCLEEYVSKIINSD